ncbi:MAG: hypothetical protein MK110_16515 [Fuerstiella sp.]|nr:hypothetical protein [Fuerstiella sp.]
MFIAGMAESGSDRQLHNRGSHVRGMLLIDETIEAERQGQAVPDGSLRRRKKAGTPAWRHTGNVESAAHR